MKSNALSMPAPVENVIPKTSKAAKPATSAPKADKNRGEVSSIRIEPAENGFSVETCFEPKAIDPKIDRYNQMPESEQMVFETPESALAYVGKMLKGQADAEAAEA